MKFTSEDLLKAMGLKMFDRVRIDKLGIFQIDILEEDVVLLEEDDGSFSDLHNLVNQDYTIIQPKPTLTEDEKVVLRNVPKIYTHIARNYNSSWCTLYDSAPIRLSQEFSSFAIWVLPFNTLFQFIKWEDEPYSIEELLGEKV